VCEQGAQQLAATPEPLLLWEGPDAFFVGWESQGDGWIARFEKRQGFPARAWAERMVELYNWGNHKPQDPVGRSVDYAPASEG
jgi:hypothetical protein